MVIDALADGRAEQAQRGSPVAADSSCVLKAAVIKPYGACGWQKESSLQGFTGEFDSLLLHLLALQLLAGLRLLTAHFQQPRSGGCRAELD